MVLGKGRRGLERQSFFWINRNTASAIEIIGCVPQASGVAFNEQLCQRRRVQRMVQQTKIVGRGSLLGVSVLVLWIGCDNSWMLVGSR